MAGTPHGDVYGKLTTELCSTDSGTSYASYASSTSVPGIPPPPSLSESEDPRETNLNFFHDFATIEMLNSGSFTKCKELTTCCRGEGQIELHQMVSESKIEMVVVKKLPVARVHVNRHKPASERELLLERRARDSEDPLAEIGVFGYLQHGEKVPEYILEMLVAFQHKDEIWLVLEYADGGDLFSVISSRQPTKELILLWSWQLLQAVAFLHRQGVCHRDISLENILLNGGDIRLMDFGQAVCSQSATGQFLRYFLATGKPYYRPPETYIPSTRKLQVVVPPGMMTGQVALAHTYPAQDFLCHVRLLDDAMAEPYGYTAPPVDVFATGVCILIMFFSSPPWKQARPKDSYFQWFQSNGLHALAKSWKKALPLSMTELLQGMLNCDSEQRPNLEQCLAHSSFASLRSAPVSFRQKTAAEMPLPRLAGDCYQPEWVCRAVETVMDFKVDEIFMGDPYQNHEMATPLPFSDAISSAVDDQETVPSAPPPLTLLREDRSEVLQLDRAFLESLG